MGVEGEEMRFYGSSNYVFCCFSIYSKIYSKYLVGVYCVKRSRIGYFFRGIV